MNYSEAGHLWTIRDFSKYHSSFWNGALEFTPEHFGLKKKEAPCMDSIGMSG